MAYIELLHLNISTRLRGLYTTWAELRIILQRFIWSEKAFMSQIQAFWEECHVQYQLEQIHHAAKVAQARPTNGSLNTSRAACYSLEGGETWSVPGQIVSGAVSLPAMAWKGRDTWPISG